MSGQTPVSRGGQSREGTPPLVPLFPGLDESSFLREGRRRGPRSQRSREARPAGSLAGDCRALICGRGTRGARRHRGTRARAGPPCCAGASCLAWSLPRLPWHPVCAHVCMCTCVACAHVSCACMPSYVWACVRVNDVLMCACVCLCTHACQCVSACTRVCIDVCPCPRAHVH